MKVYISGKITGTIKQAIINFKEAEIKLQNLGYETRNPLIPDESFDETWDFYMKRSIKLMMECDSICMLPKWKQSKGAVIEYELAKKLNYFIIYF